jgi:hypothetical protein
VSGPERLNQWAAQRTPLFVGRTRLIEPISTYNNDDRCNVIGVKVAITLTAVRLSKLTVDFNLGNKYIVVTETRAD